MLPAQILVLRIQVLDRSIIKQHTLPSPNDIMKRGLGEIKRGDGRSPNCDRGPLMAGDSLGLDLWFIVSEENEETPLGACMLNRESHKLLDQLGQHNLARQRL